MTFYNQLRLGVTCLCAAIIVVPDANAQASRKSAAKAAIQKPEVKERAASPDAQAVDEARRELDNNLLDYPRARFRAVRLVQTTKNFKAFCGEINVTNRMGGYNGWHGFVLPLGNDNIAALYDKPTIQGQPTKIASFFNTYGSKKVEGDSAGGLVQGACGPSATTVDAIDYTDALTGAVSLTRTALHTMHVCL